MTDDLRTRAERAADAFIASSASHHNRVDFVAGYMAHAAQQPTVDELVVVLHDAACTCDGTTHTPQWWENRERSARAVVAHLTKGNESDE